MSCIALWLKLVEDYGTVAEGQHTVLELKVDGPAEDALFYVFTDPFKVTDPVTMADVGYVLRDDGAFVQVCGNVMARCADEFNAAVEGTMIRSCSWFEIIAGISQLYSPVP